MKVKELIELLETLSGNTEIYEVEVSFGGLYVTVNNEDGEREVRRYMQ